MSAHAARNWSSPTVSCSRRTAMLRNERVSLSETMPRSVAASAALSKGILLCFRSVACSWADTNPVCYTASFTPAVRGWIDSLETDMRCNAPATSTSTAFPGTGGNDQSHNLEAARSPSFTTSDNGSTGPRLGVVRHPWKPSPKACAVQEKGIPCGLAFCA